MLKAEGHDLHVLLVEDNAVYRGISSKLLLFNDHVKEVFTASNVDEMWRIVKENKKINCLVLDFNLGTNSITGIQAYTMLQSQGYDLPAIILTGEDVDAFESYMVGIVDVVSKGLLYDFNRINMAINKLQRYSFFKEVQNSNGVVIPTFNGGTLKQLLGSQVLYIETQTPGCLIHIKGKAEPCQTDFSLKVYEEFLENTNFMKLSRFHLVNVEHISSYDDEEEITLSDGTKLIISSEGKRLVKLLLNSNGTFKRILEPFMTLKPVH
ncbi:LytR/AlgR family response regulator transcription factor [Brevibacillus reuszeri]|uniref:LytR/AlgR family response regulator transcription factor n=1 Tax=Brevibacillus reuszeri TaxID=54915 RepID=UPI0013DFDFE7|nr:response regulator [Brevibacillus reuszeri]